MIFTLTAVLLREIVIFSRRLKFHFLYFHLNFHGLDQGLTFLERRTVLLTSYKSLLESEEEIQQNINKYLQKKEGERYQALSVIKLPNYTKVYYIERTMKRRRLYKFLYEKKNLINKICLFFYPRVVKNEQKFEVFMEKKQKQLDEAIETIEDSSYALVCFNSFESIQKFKKYCRGNKKEIGSKICLANEKKMKYKLSHSIKFADIYWKHCHFQPPVTANCLSWKLVVSLIFVIIMVLFSTPTIIINYILTNSPFVKDVFGNEYNTNDFFPYLLTEFLPPLFIIGINRLFYFVIFRSTQREKKLRLSRYHLKVSHVSFLYVVWNSLILPGLALPAGLNFYTYLFGSSEVKISKLIKNFYGYSNVNFFMTISIQKIFLSFFGLSSQFGLIIHYYVSPATFSFIKKYFNVNYTINMLRESATFNFGYYYSLNMVVFWTGLVYAVHTPFITFINMCYLLMRNLFDFNVLLNLFKNQVESNGKIIFLQRNRIVIGLILVQICLIFTTASEQKYLATGLIIVILIFTIFFKFIIVRKFLTFTLICKSNKKNQQNKYTNQDIEKWRYLYQHPFSHKYDPVKKQRKEVNTCWSDEEEHNVYKMHRKQLLQLDKPESLDHDILNFQSYHDEESNILECNFEGYKKQEQKNNIFDILKSSNSYSLDVIPENLIENEEFTRKKKQSLHLFPSDVIKSKRNNQLYINYFTNEKQ